MSNIKNLGELKCYECSLNKENWTSINETSRGRAKVSFFRGIEDMSNFTDIYCRVVGKVRTSDEFIKNAKYRNIEFAYCGMVVSVDGMSGVITGHNSSANLDVLFVEGQYKGTVMSCHPNHKIAYYNKNKEIIKQF